jgi:hypothetical protein
MPAATTEAMTPDSKGLAPVWLLQATYTSFRDIPLVDPAHSVPSHTQNRKGSTSPLTQQMPVIGPYAKLIPGSYVKIVIGGNGSYAYTRLWLVEL